MTQQALTYAQSRESFRLSLGHAVCAAPTGGVLLAKADNSALLPCIGLVAVVNQQNLTVGIVNQGPLKLYNWISIIGSAFLSPNTTYYLSTSLGMLTADANQAGALLHQAIGSAIAPDTLLVQIAIAAPKPIQDPVLIDRTTGDRVTLFVDDGQVKIEVPA